MRLQDRTLITSILENLSNSPVRTQIEVLAMCLSYIISRNTINVHEMFEDFTKVFWRCYNYRLS